MAPRAGADPQGLRRAIDPPKTIPVGESGGVGQLGWRSAYFTFGTVLGAAIDKHSAKLSNPHGVNEETGQ